MTKSKTTKRALLSSAMALLLCFTMLLGTTFAWFTDSAASGSNVITAGNLDMEVSYTLDGTTWNKLDGATDLFKKGLWEPGHTEVVVLKIENKGTLALKYVANMNIVNETVGKTKDGESIVLSDILTVSTCTQQYTDGNGNVASGADIFPAMAFNGEGGVDGWIGYQTTSTFKAGNVLKSDKQLQPKESDYIVIKVDMAETVRNEANHNGTDIPKINFGINLMATQYTHENDSFGNQYDANADYDNPEDLGYEVVYIYNLDDFAAFGKAVNNNSTYGGVNVANNSKVWVEVMADIDMTSAPAIQATEFAIGNGSNIVFAGVFDGNNHTISNYHIEASWTYNVSLFRTVGAGFTMRDIVFDNCSASKTNNRGTALLVGTYGSRGAITFDNVDIKNSSVAGVTKVGGYVYGMTEGAIYFFDCDAENVTITATSEEAVVGMFFGDGWSHHDYEESGIWVENCSMTGCKSIVNNVEQSTISEYNYTK